MHTTEAPVLVDEHHSYNEKEAQHVGARGGVRSRTHCWRVHAAVAMLECNVRAMPLRRPPSPLHRPALSPFSW
jgi:anti-sigma-K factor RskA